MSKKLIYLMSFVLVLAVTGTASADQLAITVLNAGFEDPVLAEDGYTWLDIPGWIPVGGEGPGIWNVTLSDFDPVVAPEGQNVLYTENAVGDPGGVAQVLTETFAANMDYTLTVEVGNSYYYYNAGYSVQLLAGGVVIAEDNDTLWPDYKKWATSTVQYTYDSADSVLVGQPLEIRLLNLGLDKDSPPAGDAVGVEFDNVTLSYLEVVQGPVYLWNGSAGDGLWETPLNWTVTDSVWTWPNEENAADPNLAAYVNSDVLGIDIIDGGAVTRGDTLRIKGADELTTAVLTLDNASSLSVSGRLSIGTDPDDAPRMGELNVLNGSILTILDGANGNDLYAADDPNTVGTINIVDSTVNVFDRIAIDEGEGTINITDSVIVAGDILIGDGTTGVGTMNVSGATTIDLEGDLKAGDDGEGHVNISGSTTLNCDDLYVADKATATGSLDISGTVTVNLVDDLEVAEEGQGTATIGGDAVVNLDDIMVGEKDGAVGELTITDNATVNLVDDLEIGEEAGSIGTMTISGNATVNVPDEVYIGDEPNSTGTLNVSGTATLNVVDDIDVGDEGLGTLNISENGTVNVEDNLYIAELAGSEGHMTVSGNGTLNVVDDIDVGDYDFGTLDVSENATLNIDDDISVGQNDGTEGRMTISGNATVNAEDLVVCESGGSTGYLHISGNPTINLTESLYMNDDHDDVPSTSQVIMDGGTITAGSYCTIGDDNSGTAEFIMNGGSFYCADYLNLADDLDGTAHLTINGGEIITGNRLLLGNDGGDDTGQVRIFMNGGLLQAEELSDIKITDTQIIYTRGEIRIRQPFQPDPVGDPNTWWGLSEADMQDLIDNGTIVAVGAYSIVTDGDYTALVNKAASGPNPANGAEDVALDATLSWWPGFGAVSHDGYIGISSPPPFIGNTPEVTFDPGVLGGLQPNTTYYWQLNAVEADGTTHIGDIWSFTTMDTSLVAYYPLDEGSGNIAADASGNGHDGAIQGTPTWIDSMSGYGTALYFDGSNPANGYVNLGTWNPSEGTGQLTVALWARYDGPVEGVWQGLIGKRDRWGADTMMWQIEINSNNQQITFERQGSQLSYGGATLPEGQWAHVAATFNGTTAVSYINGEEVGRGDFTLGTGTDAGMSFGCDRTNGWNSFHGALDEVMLYNRALSDLEVLDLLSNE